VAWRRGWGWGAAAIGAGLVAASCPYHYGYYPYDGYYGYGGWVLQRQLVATGWGYQTALVRVCC
jgi:hypothetical protein